MGIKEVQVKRPIVGVFVSRAVIQKLKKQLNDFRSYIRIKQLADASQEAEVTIYYFSARAVDLEGETVKGIYWDTEHQKWKSKRYPLPDVLYDRRGAGRTRKARERALQVRAFLDEKKVQKINSVSYFNKWDVYEHLSRAPETSRYIPDTRFYERRKDLRSFLGKHDQVYLKAVRGGRGKQVVRVVELEDKTYEICHFVDQIYVGKAESIAELNSEVRSFFDGRPFVMQKAIDLLQIENSNVDFRAELQRNGKGRLEILGVSARVGQQKAPITIHSSAFPFESFLRQYQLIPEHEIPSLTKKVRHFLRTAYHALEDIYGTFGEIGIDFGIDKNGDIWFIEPNAKSAKVSFQKAYDSAAFQRAFLNPLEFAKYLYDKERKKRRHSR
ncbi:YheC/YheD family protein [Cohnella pontilimi]|nr:YheC/YheD family protein [Cohnella pontilimi]